MCVRCCQRLDTYACLHMHILTYGRRKQHIATCHPRTKSHKTHSKHVMNTIRKYIIYIYIYTNIYTHINGEGSGALFLASPTQVCYALAPPRERPASFWGGPGTLEDRPRAPRASPRDSQRHSRDLWCRKCNKNNGFSMFLKAPMSSKEDPWGIPGNPWGLPGEPQGRPETTQGPPEASQGHPGWAQGRPRTSQELPGDPREPPRESLGNAQGPPGTPRDSQEPPRQP